MLRVLAPVVFRSTYLEIWTPDLHTSMSLVTSEITIF